MICWSFKSDDFIEIYHVWLKSILLKTTINFGGITVASHGGFNPRKRLTSVF